jgi:hypothetical protein
MLYNAGAMRIQQFIYGVLLINACSTPLLPADGSVMSADSGTGGVIATTEAGSIDSQEVEAGSPQVEAGSQEVEAGTPRVEAGAPRVEAGSPPVEAGAPPVEAGTHPVEAGTPQMEVGSLDVGREVGAEAGADVLTAGDGPSWAGCKDGVKDLTNVGKGDFSIAFRLATKQTGWVALLNQRGACSGGMFWDIRQAASGQIFVEVENEGESPYGSLTSIRSINDGYPHGVVVARTMGKLTIHVDGSLVATNASAASLGILWPLDVGGDICGPSSDPSTALFAGTLLADVCLKK